MKPPGEQPVNFPGEKINLQRILPDLIKKVAKQMPEFVIVAERNMFIKEQEGTKKTFA